MVWDILSVKHIWVIYESGLCILEDAYVTNDKNHMDETLMGGFIAALFSFSETMTSSGIDSISMGDMIMHYASGEGIILCIAVEKKIKRDLAQETVKRIHNEFLVRFSEILKSQGTVDTLIFEPFKVFCSEYLLSRKLLPKSYIKEKSDSESLLEKSSKVTMLIQTLLTGENPKKIAEDLKSMFSILGSSKDGKEFRKVLVDFDKFINKLKIEQTTKKMILSLISEIRSFATIDEWLG